MEHRQPGRGPLGSRAGGAWLPVSGAGASHGCAEGRHRPDTSSPGLPAANMGGARGSLGGSPSQLTRPTAGLYRISPRSGTRKRGSCSPPHRLAENLPAAKYAQLHTLGPQMAGLLPWDLTKGPTPCKSSVSKQRRDYFPIAQKKKA